MSGVGYTSNESCFVKLPGIQAKSCGTSGKGPYPVDLMGPLQLLVMCFVTARVARLGPHELENNTAVVGYTMSAGR